MSTVLGNRRKAIGQLTAVELIERLDEQFPHRCIGRDETLDHAYYYAGKRDLVDTLLAQLKREDK
jgi:hypothetical protein